MLDYIVSNWSALLVAAILGSAIGVGVFNFMQKTSDEKIAEVKKWLLYAVKCAEDEFGSKTGEIKLGFVYDMFVKRFPSVARVISFEDFTIYVQEALNSLEEILATQTELSDNYGLEEEEKNNEQ